MRKFRFFGLSLVFLGFGAFAHSECRAADWVNKATYDGPTGRACKAMILSFETEHKGQSVIDAHDDFLATMLEKTKNLPGDAQNDILASCPSMFYETGPNGVITRERPELRTPLK